MASAKKPVSGKTKNPCHPPPKGKPPSPKNNGVTLDQMKADMAAEGSPAIAKGIDMAMDGSDRSVLTVADGQGKVLVQREPSKRDVTYEDGEETLPCKLTAEEIEKLDKRSVHLVGEIETKKSQIASTQSQLNGEIKSMQQNLSNMAKKAREGTEYRMIATRTFMDYPQCTVYTIRVDTGETLRSRAMERDELNLELSDQRGKTFKDLARRPLEDTTTICE